MNKHVKYGLKLLVAPVALVYFVAAVLAAIFILGPLLFVSGCHGADDPFELAIDILVFPVTWYREL